MRIFLFIISLTMLTSCKKSDIEKEPESDYKPFTSYNEFYKTITSLAAQQDKTRLLTFWDSLKKHKQIPFVFEDSVAFLYLGDARKVQWAGDFNGWNPDAPGYTSDSAGNRLWILKQNYPKDARLDYKVVVDGSQWKLDPGNSYIQYSGFGPNSELRMPDWVYPAETKLIEGANRGSLSANQYIESIPANLGYKVQYKVYTPYNYENLSNLPVVYVTDGQEYADDRLGSMLIVLDNLIYEGKIEPLIAVFIDPRDPDNLSSNRRMEEYAGNMRFANFVADELVNAIDSEYSTDKNPEKRCIMGTSMGGWNAAYFGLVRSDVFQLLAIHSPAFNSQIMNDYLQSANLPLKIFMSTGVINDTQDRARQMKDILEQKGYPLLYIEVNQGHSWGNWRALIQEPLEYFFGPSTQL